MTHSSSSMDLHRAVEDFLAHTRIHRTEVIHKRYTQAMELLMSFLAVELLDPEPDTGDTNRGPAGSLSELTPEVLRRYTGAFLTERLGSDSRLLKRHLLATRAFLRYLTAQGHVDPIKMEALAAVVRTALRTVDSDVPGPQLTVESLEEETDSVQLYRVLAADLPHLDLENMVSGEVLEHVQLANPEDYRPQEQDICMMTVDQNPHGATGRCLGVLDSAVNFAEGATPEDLAAGAFEDTEGELTDEEGRSDDIDFTLSPEDALEILAVEDRYAPRGVIQSVIDGYDLVRDELLEWILRNEYRDTPFPGAGEAPANAARILSEMGEMEILDRLLEVLGDQDPLGEEAPVALARLGPDVLPDIERVLEKRTGSHERFSAAVWTLGYMAARHPAVRGVVLDRLVEIAEGNGPVAPDAIQVLGELRASEMLPRLKRSCTLGRLNLEPLGYTPDLLEHQITSPSWGESVAEALVPLAFLYPTEEELEELYSAVEDELDDWDPLDAEERDEEPATFEDEDEEEEEEKDEAHPKDRANADRPGTASDRPAGDQGGKVIPFIPTSPKNEKE